MKKSFLYELLVSNEFILPNEIGSKDLVKKMVDQKEFEEIENLAKREEINIYPFKGQFLNFFFYESGRRHSVDIDLIISIKNFLSLHKVFKRKNYRLCCTLANLIRLQVTYKKNITEFDCHYFIPKFGKMRENYTKSEANEKLVYNMLFLIRGCVRDLKFDKKRKSDISNIALYLIKNDIKIPEIDKGMEKIYQIYIAEKNGILKYKFPKIEQARNSKGMKRFFLKLSEGTLLLV